MSGDNRRWDRKDSRRSNTQKVVKTAEDELESKLGFGLFSEGETRLGWLLTFASVSLHRTLSYELNLGIELRFRTRFLRQSMWFDLISTRFTDWL